MISSKSKLVSVPEKEFRGMDKFSYLGDCVSYTMSASIHKAQLAFYQFETSPRSAGRMRIDKMSGFYCNSETSSNM